MTVHAYLLRCRDGSFYAGHTENLELRIAQHEQGVTGGYTATRRPVVLVWTENFGTRDEALAAERRIKGMEPGHEAGIDRRRLGVTETARP